MICLHLLAQLEQGAQRLGTTGTVSVLSRVALSPPTLAQVSRVLRDAAPRAQCSGCWPGMGGMQGTGCPALGVWAEDPSVPPPMAAPTLASCREEDGRFLLAPGASSRISRA